MTYDPGYLHLMLLSNCSIDMTLEIRGGLIQALTRRLESTNDEHDLDSSMRHVGLLNETRSMQVWGMQAKECNG